MIHVKIGDTEKELTNVDDEWVHQQINRQRAAGEVVCVQVRIEKGDIQMRLSTSACPKGPSGRAPNRHEAAIFDQWDQCGMNDEHFSSNNLIVFIRNFLS